MEYFGVPGIRLDWSIQIKKSETLVSSMELLSKVHTGEGPGGQGRLTRAVGEVLSGACICF